MGELSIRDLEARARLAKTTGGDVLVPELTWALWRTETGILTSRCHLVNVETGECLCGLWAPMKEEITYMAEATYVTGSRDFPVVKAGGGEIRQVPDLLGLEKMFRSRMPPACRTCWWAAGSHGFWRTTGGVEPPVD